MVITLTIKEVHEIVIAHIKKAHPEWADKELYSQDENYDSGDWEIGIKETP